MEFDQFGTSNDLFGLPILPIQASSAIYVAGEFERFFCGKNHIRALHIAQSDNP